LNPCCNRYEASLATEIDLRNVKNNIPSENRDGGGGIGMLGSNALHLAEPKNYTNASSLIE